MASSRVTAAGRSARVLMAVFAGSSGGDVRGGEDGSRGGVEFLFVEVEGGALRVYQQEGEKYGVVGDVAAAQVGQPGDVVQAGDEVVFRAVFLHGAADAGEFRGGRLADVGRVVRVDGRLW